MPARTPIMMEMTFRWVTGQERAERLTAFGFPPGLLAAVTTPTSDQVSKEVWAAGGDSFAAWEADGLFREIESGLVRGLGISAGTIAPVAHVQEGSTHYVLLVSRDEDDVLVEWTEESVRVIVGGVFGFLTDAYSSAWEGNAVPDDALLEWAERLGFQGAKELHGWLEEGEASATAYRAWVTAFVGRHAAR